ncbi:MAG: 2-phospho-L-lactate transferase [Propionicimonas sp.]|uniref:2-phospho-L-lactate transferase n=1 Tax=Propionicimonas sp. TaxID=1955623 RepID=UPI003D0BAD4F
MSGDPPRRIVVLSGGVGGARFIRGLLAHLTGADAAVTVVVNTGDDLWLHGLRICPDLDTLVYTLGGGIDEERGWGRRDEHYVVAEELSAYGAGGEWFTLGDRDLATHIVRTAMLRDGRPLSEVARVLAARWGVAAAVLAMSDQEVETWIELAEPTPDGEVLIDFESWWVKYRAGLRARRFVQKGVEHAFPAPGVLDAIGTADLILFPPSNPVVSIGTILGVPGIADAIRSASAPVVGVSPIIGDGPVRGMAGECLHALGVPVSAAGVAGWYRRTHEVLDAWLVDESDAGQLDELRGLGLVAEAVPLWMRDPATTEALAGRAVEVGVDLLR